MKLEGFEESSERDKCGHLGGLVIKLTMYIQL